MSHANSITGRQDDGGLGEIGHGVKIDFPGKLFKEFKQKYNFMNYALAGSGPTQQYVILKDKVNLENVKYVIHFIESIEM